MTSDSSKVTKALKAVSKTAKKWTNVDVDSAASIGGFARGDAVKKLQEWNNCGAIELQPSGVVNRFRILKDFPKSDEAKNDIIATVYQQIEARERDDMARIHQVIDLITTRSCISRGLAKHFGDEQSVAEAGCGNCSFCQMKRPVGFAQNQKLSRKGRINEAKFKAILNATPIRDDPRFLARVAFGIGSPRVTMEKLGKNAVFGSMDDCDFEVCAIGCSKILRLADIVPNVGAGTTIRQGLQVMTCQTPSQPSSKLWMAVGKDMLSLDDLWVRVVDSGVSNFEVSNNPSRRPFLSGQEPDYRRHRSALGKVSRRQAVDYWWLALQHLRCEERVLRITATV